MVRPLPCLPLSLAFPPLLRSSFGLGRLGSCLMGRVGFDWALVIFLWFFLSWLNTVEGHKREFSLDDKSIQHTFAVV
jgi:hypothetical protein